MNGKMYVFQNKEDDNDTICIVGENEDQARWSLIQSFNKNEADYKVIDIWETW